VTRDFIGLGALEASDPEILGEPASESSFVHGAPVRTSWKFAIQGGYAFAADVNLGFRVVALGSMEQVAQIDEPRKWTSVVLAGQMAYGTTADHDPKEGDPQAKRSLRILDVTSPTQPRLAGLLKMENNAQAIALQERYLYYPDFLEMKQLTEGEFAGMHVIDVSDPANPIQVGEADTTGHCPQASSIVIKGSYAILGDMQNGLCVVDITDPTDPRLVSTWRDIPPVYDMVLVGERIFAACYSHVAAIDVSDPKEPKLEDITVTPGLAWGIDAAGDTVYVADMDGGLAILGYR
jgi:hypothetical protein